MMLKLENRLEIKDVVAGHGTRRKKEIGSRGRIEVGLIGRNFAWGPLNASSVRRVFRKANPPVGSPVSPVHHWEAAILDEGPPCGRRRRQYIKKGGKLPKTSFFDTFDPPYGSARDPCGGVHSKGR